jgi:hypothetical protein
MVHEYRNVAVSHLALKNLPLVAVSFEHCGAGFRLRPLSREPAYRFRPTNVCRSADPRFTQDERCERHQNGRVSPSHNAPFPVIELRALAIYDLWEQIPALDRRRTRP